MKSYSALQCFGAEAHRSVTAFCIARERESFIDIPVCTDESPPTLGTLPQLHLARMLVEHFVRVALSHHWVLRNELFVAAGAYKWALVSTG